MTDRQPRRWFHDTSWDELEPTPARPGVRAVQFAVGPGDDPDPCEVVRAEFDPGVTVEAHSHDCDYAEIILEGAERVGRQWKRVGDIRIVKAGTVYGPLVAGPDGVVKLIVFARQQRTMLSASDAVASGGDT